MQTSIKMGESPRLFIIIIMLIILIYFLGTFKNVKYYLRSVDNSTFPLLSPKEYTHFVGENICLGWAKTKSLGH